jgi:hypothetical protein
VNYKQAALDYVARGWSVIPLRVKDKKPAISSWIQFQKERASAERIEDYWNRNPQANIGIVTGSVSGIIVLDVDGPEGDASLKRIEARFGELPETPMSTTGKGRHYIFNHPGGDLRNFAKRGINLDFRGDGGYIVAPPSIHPNGSIYRWEISPDESEIADPPEWLIELLTSEQPPAWYLELFPPPKETKATGKVSGTTGNGQADTILKNCAFCQYCKDNAKELSEPEWYSMITNLARAEGGRELIHELSRPYPGYSERETEKKIEHALQDGEPHTCQYIQTNLGFSGCPEGGCGVKAPIGFVTSPVVSARLTISAVINQLKTEPDTSVIYSDPETIGALAVLKKQDPAEYAQTKKQFKDLCGKELNLNDLERAVNRKIAENQKLHLVDSSEPPPELKDILPDMPNVKLKKPYAWTLNENGIWQDTKFGPVCACPVPVILTKRLKNVDTGEEKIELAFFRDQKWRTVIANRSTVFNRTSLISLADRGLPISSESSKHLVRFLQDFERENLNALPLVQSVSRMGWVGSGTFLPGAENDIVLDVDQGGAASVAAGYRQEGNLSEWVYFIEPVRQYPIARFTLSASFAAPLLKILNQRVFIVHNWGPSRGGKTASLKAALSVWGDPDEIMASFNATKVGLERLAAFYSDLPLGIDERQVVGDRQGFVESLVYLLGLGKGKARGAKGGGLQAFQSWRTIALTTGEEPLSSGSSTAGIKTRTLELYGQPIPDEKLASKIHQGIGRSFGLAGPEFVRRIIHEMRQDPEIFQTDYEAIYNEISSRSNENMSSHIAALSIVCMADYYASQWIFNRDEEQALDEALGMAEGLMGQLESVAESDDGARAYEYLMGWAAENHKRFDIDSNSSQFGWKDNDYIYFIGNVFDEAVQSGGYSPRRILQDWADRGWIKTTIESGKKRMKIKAWSEGLKVHVRVVAVKVPQSSRDDFPA